MATDVHHRYTGSTSGAALRTTAEAASSAEGSETVTASQQQVQTEPTPQQPERTTRQYEQLPTKTGVSRAKRLLTKAGHTASSTSNSRRVAERVARKAVDRIVSDSSPSTQPIPILAVLKGTPFQAPVEAAAKSEAEARMILDLSVDIGAMMMRAGAGSSDVEVSVIASCTALGLPSVEVDLTSNSLTVHYADPDGQFTTVMRVNREDSVHFAKLSAIHRLVSDLVDGKADYSEARERIDSIRRQRRPFTSAMVALAEGVLVGGFVILLGGAYLTALLGLIMAILSGQFGKILTRTGMPVFFILMAQASFATLVAMGAATVNLIAAPSFLVASGIVLLLPTLGLISAVQDSLTSFPLTAASRTVMVLIAMAGIISGIALGIMVGRSLGLSAIDIVVRGAGVDALTTIMSGVAASVVGACGAITLLAAKRIVWRSAFLGLVGFIAWLACSVFGMGNILAGFIAATLTALLCRLAAARWQVPAIVLLIPAIYPLLQGLSIFSAVYQIVLPEEEVTLAAGLSALFLAITANAGLAVGAVLGDFLGRPLAVRLGNVRIRLKKQRQGEKAIAVERHDSAGSVLSTGSISRSDRVKEMRQTAAPEDLNTDSPIDIHTPQGT